jgi:transcriptional regulator with XRE-family HTH domain
MQQSLGKRIRLLRKEKRLSQTELAHLSDIPSQSKISSWESGICIPDVWEAQKLAQIFGVSLEYLLSEG